MKKHHYSLSSKVWLYPGHAGWHFMSVPKTEASRISQDFALKTRGWSSLPVMVTIGQTAWQTSIFKEKVSGTYLLPVKAVVRKKESIYVDDVVKYKIQILV